MSIKARPGDLIEVGWRDIAAHVNINDVRDAQPAEAINVGWLVDVRGGVMRLASGIYPDSQAGDVVAIPMGVVKSVRVIERKAK